MECSRKSAPLDGSVYSRALDPSAKYERLSRIRPNDKVLQVNRAGHAAGLVRTFEVTLNAASSLLEIKILGRGGSIGVIAVQGPLTLDIRWKGLFRGLLRPCREASRYDEREIEARRTDASSHG
jgi:hypothetical protein